MVFNRNMFRDKLFKVSCMLVSVNMGSVFNVPVIFIKNCIKTDIYM